MIPPSFVSTRFRSALSLTKACVRYMRVREDLAKNESEQKFSTGIAYTVGQTRSVLSLPAPTLVDIAYFKPAHQRRQ
eukprot:1980676-Rhodomonas_salina.2